MEMRIWGARGWREEPLRDYRAFWAAALRVVDRLAAPAKDFDILRVRARDASVRLQVQIVQNGVRRLHEHLLAAFVRELA